MKTATNLKRVSRERRNGFASDTFETKVDGRTIQVTIFSDAAPIWETSDVDEDTRIAILNEIAERFDL